MGVPERLLSGREVSVSTFQREFELQDILVYVKTGIGSIIEDEVTQRFVAEELKVREGRTCAGATHSRLGSSHLQVLPALMCFFFRAGTF